MDIAHIITSLHPIILFGLVIVFCILCAEGGAIVAQFRVKKGIKEPDAPLGTAVGAMLGLLAFMLGFNFSITASRFADRKELTIRQANAIGTCYLRTSTIPEKQKQEIRKYFRQYVDILLGKGYDETRIEEAVKKLDKLHIQIWRQTASLVQENMDSELRSLFTASVNSVIDIAGERKTVALVFRIPSMLWTSLFLLAGLSMFSIGYQTGTFGHRRILDLPLLAAAFALVIVMIANMDSVAEHRFKVSLKPFSDLEEMMQEEIP
ncbi:hypothetical protein I5M27_16985 [Adhaeribacter sp. BT258]|uniref:DUF4239 domain-containing protein n=1 Tax=Adhaeribacter terrigena TaxID=2793070 RepID=A0ABS1C673_9BACT|nr:hypothetical protein [Adhaeribacter terrigena]MBK0404692.1 hypothetical protein [Adhaeribacter terrigena]